MDIRAKALNTTTTLAIKQNRISGTSRLIFNNTFFIHTKRQKLFCGFLYEGHPKNNESCYISREPWHVAHWNFTMSMLQPYTHNRHKNESHSVTSCSVTSFRLTSYPRLRSGWDFLISFNHYRFQEYLLKTLPIGYEGYCLSASR